MPRKPKGRPPYADVLTPTEWRVLHAVQHGMTNVEIARRRGTSTDAVKYHVGNILVKLGVRNRRELRRLSLKPAESPLHGKDGGKTIATFAAGKLGQVARTVRNIAESQTWYREVLGATHLYTFGTLAFFDLAGTRLMLSEAETAKTQDSILYFSAPDIDAAYALLQSRGVEFLNAPHMIHRHADGTEEWMCFFKDPESRPLALISQVRSPAHDATRRRAPDSDQSHDPA